MLEFRSRRARVLLQVVVALMIIPFLAPFIAMISQVFSGRGVVENFSAVLARPELGGFFVSSAIIAVGTVSISYISTMFAAYALANLRHWGKGVVLAVMIGALTLPGASLIVPLFYVVSTAGLYDNYLAVILPVAILTVPFNVILARAYLLSLPADLFEAASLDGASTWGIFRHVVLPLSAPITAVVIVWTFTAAWNEYLLPLLFFQDPAKGTVTLLTTFFTSEYSTDQPRVIAASMVALLPTVLIYLFVQRFFERGITAGSLK